MNHIGISEILGFSSDSGLEYTQLWEIIKIKCIIQFAWKKEKCTCTDSSGKTQDVEVWKYAITEVNIEDKPEGCIAQFAVCETVNLPFFKEKQWILHRDGYTDDILKSLNDLSQLKTIIENIELILKTGEFEPSPWIFSGHSGSKEHSNEEENTKANTMVMPNQM